MMTNNLYFFCVNQSIFNMVNGILSKETVLRSKEIVLRSQESVHKLLIIKILHYFKMSLNSVPILIKKRQLRLNNS